MSYQREMVFTLCIPHAAQLLPLTSMLRKFSGMIISVKQAGKATETSPTGCPLPAPPGKDNNVPTKAQNEPLTIEQLREMDGEPVWVEEVEHWALIDIEKSGQWAGIPFAVWAENGANFTYNIEGRKLHCFRRPPEGEEDT